MIDWPTLSATLHRHFDADTAQATLERLWKRFGADGDLPADNNHLLSFAFTAARNIRASAYAHHRMHMKWLEQAHTHTDVERRTPELIGILREELDTLNSLFPALIDAALGPPRRTGTAFRQRKRARELLGR